MSVGRTVNNYGLSATTETFKYLQISTGTYGAKAD